MTNISINKESKWKDGEPTKEMYVKAASLKLDFVSTKQRLLQNNKEYLTESELLFVVGSEMPAIVFPITVDIYLFEKLLDSRRALVEKIDSLLKKTNKLAIAARFEAAAKFVKVSV